MASADNSATYQLPEGATSFHVTLRILSPETQASWTVFVRDGVGRKVGSVSVPRGQGGVAFAIVAPSRGATGPITLTVSADPAQAGRSSGAYDLEVAAAVLASTDPSAPAPTAADDMAFSFISANGNANANTTLDEGTACRPHASPGPGALSAGAASSAPPSGSIEPAYPKPTSGGVVRTPLTEELPSEEQAEAADSEPLEHDAAVAQGDSPEMSDLACSARQAVDAPGGLPEEATEGRHGVRARRLAEEGALRHPGTRSGTVVVSAIVAAGLIVPNVLILGAPRFRPSRLRWRRAPQRRTSPSAAD
jgi:hypothetical protein